ncbi:hypothetical protein B9Z55_003567 [Caenorhabditis nigoni]|uniref:Uncharacterized protein n=1 Tax=Caenorhabditis nigoni TaxID=1611254 RepID=A0A2G5VRD4_9PELO|nr:hypothetical protein B9Z55_003567 [Caenorhabditis nigoni]
MLLRHQKESKGALHILLGHAQDMLEILPLLDIEAFPPPVYQFIKKDKDNVAKGRPREKKLEFEKILMVKQAKAYYDMKPEDREKLKGAEHYYKGKLKHREMMFPNEVCLVAYLRIHVKHRTFLFHQFFTPDAAPLKKQFRVNFQVPTTSEQIRALSICLSCSEDGKGTALVYRTPGSCNMQYHCYEIITAFLLKGIDIPVGLLPSGAGPPGPRLHYP